MYTLEETSFEVKEFLKREGYTSASLLELDNVSREQLIKTFIKKHGEGHDSASVRDVIEFVCGVYEEQIQRRLHKIKKAGDAFSGNHDVRLREIRYETLAQEDELIKFKRRLSSQYIDNVIKSEKFERTKQEELEDDERRERERLVHERMFLREHIDAMKDIVRVSHSVNPLAISAINRLEKQESLLGGDELAEKQVEDLFREFSAVVNKV